MTFLPWMGSKRRLLPQLLAKVPRGFQRYHEPFLGSGALLYALRPPAALCADVLPSLIALHEAVARDAAGVCREFERVARTPDRRATFLAIRDRYPRVEPAEFLFMMKNCHGTRYRVNSSGRFNCPYKVSNREDMTEKAISADCARIRAATVGTGVHFAVRDVEESLKLVGPGDLVFLDPPYQWQEGKEADYGRKFGPAGWASLMQCLADVPAAAYIMVTLHGGMEREEVLRLAAGVPGLTHLQALDLWGSHIARGGLSKRKEWLLTNYAC